MSKQQTMSHETFFNELCVELELSGTTSDEDSVIRATRRVAHRSAKLSKMSKEALRIWEALPPGTVLSPALDELMRWLIKS